MGDSKNTNKPKVNMPRFNLTWLYIIIAVTLGVLWFSGQEGNYSKQLTYTEFKDLVNKGYVNKVVSYDDKSVEVYIKPQFVKTVFKKDYTKVGRNPMMTVVVGSQESLEKFLDKAQEEGHFSGTIVYDKKNDYFGAIFWNIAPFIFLIAIWIFLIRKIGGGGGNSGGANQIGTIVYDKKNDYFGAIFWNIAPFIFLIAIWIFLIRKIGGGGGNSGGANPFNVGKSRATVYEKGNGTRVTFKDVAGQAGAKQEVEEIVEFLKQPQKYTELGGKIPKGALLVGPPGTGKTLLAKAVAGEADVPFFSLSGSDFVEMFVGVGASRVRDLFRQAKEKAPCIIFIDEIDAVGRARGKNPALGGNDERESTLNQLLTEMDGFDTYSGVIFVAATNGG